MEPFTSSIENQYIFHAVDYVSRKVEAIRTPTIDAKVVFKFLQKRVFFFFPRFGIPKANITDELFTFLQ